MNTSNSPAVPSEPPAPAPVNATPRWHERVLFWAPVWLPMAVLTQLAWLGLGPALGEQRRLASAEHELAQRLDRETSEQAQLARWVRAQNDPIYLERERRRLRDERRAADDEPVQREDSAQR